MLLAVVGSEHGLLCQAIAGEHDADAHPSQPAAAANSRKHAQTLTVSPWSSPGGYRPRRCDVCSLRTNSEDDTREKRER